MRAFLAFFKKELLSGTRSGKLLTLAVIFLLLGVMNPAIAKMTPWLLEMLSEQLSESGVTVHDVTVNALTSWTQFFKNLPIALIAFVLLLGGCFTQEYESETLVLLLTKGLSRYKVVLAKASYLLLAWTVGYWLSFGITYAYNAYFWDNSVALGLWHAVLNYWVFGCLAVSATVFFSTLARSYGTVLLLCGTSLLLLYLLRLLPRLSRVSPFALTDTAALLVGAESPSEFVPALCITAALCLALLGMSIPFINKKRF